MEIIKQTDTQLIFEVKIEKTTKYFFWGVCIVVDIALVTLFILGFGMGAIYWALFIVFILDLIYLQNLNKTNTVTVDKAKDTLEIKENNNITYVSDYPLEEIKQVKTVIGHEGFKHTFASLVIVLKNNNEKIADKESYYENGFPHLDIRANRQAEIGKGIAKFLNVPYRDGEYKP